VALTASGFVLTWGKNEKNCLGRSSVSNGSFEKDSEDPILHKAVAIRASRYSTVAWGKKFCIFY
jgi:hypothetical protein